MNDEVVAFSADLLSGCAMLYARVFSSAPWSEPWTLEKAERRLSDILATPGSEGLVWIDPETLTPIGAAIGHVVQGAVEPLFKLSELFVHPQWQGQGIGARLLRQLEQTVAALGARSIVLTTEGRPAEFYSRLGYATRPDWIAMSRHLD